MSSDLHPQPEPHSPNLHSEWVWRIRVDTGGTFTDGWGRTPDGQEVRCKILSSGVIRTQVDELLGGGRLRVASACGAADGVLVGFLETGGGRVAGWSARERILVLEGGGELEPGAVVELSSGEEAPVVAARLLTGTAPGGQFPPMDLRVATTRGTNALLERKGAQGVLFVTAGFEDLLAIRDQRRPDLFALQQQLPLPVFQCSVGVEERVAVDGRVVRGLDEDRLSGDIRRLRELGHTVAAVALLHSGANPGHERRVGELLEEAGFVEITLSSDLSRQPRFLARAETAAANAYLAPVMNRFVEGVRARVGAAELSLMTSAGALKSAEDYRPVDGLLSGPAGGVMGALAAAQRAGSDRILAFDMGGTSTDVARLEGAPSYRYEQSIGPVRVVAPTVRIETVAAGGGSICRWREGGLEVGPESAGADPGPACYGRGGPLTMTDVNLLLGCMDAGRAGIPLDGDAARRAFEELKSEMRLGGAEVGPDHDLLEGLREIAVERMAEAIRKVSLRDGYRPADYALVAFGGAGPQHACAVAERLGIDEILVPGDAGLLSAWGLHRARRQRIAERQVLAPLEEVADEWNSLVAELEEEALHGLGNGSSVERVLCELRLWGQDTALEVEWPGRPGVPEVRETFQKRYRELYGYEIPAGRAVELVAVRVVGTEEGTPAEGERFEPAGDPVERRELRQDRFRTCVIEPGWQVAEGSRGSLRLRRGRFGERAGGWSEDVEAELYRCRFESVVEEMGELLRRTAISTNIKERLDYSCALLDRDGRLIVNAPHIPVHLGALGECVRRVSEGRRWREGDLVVVNHPGYGGSHLPDVTVVSPVFVEGRLLAYVANRAHHAEIGGLAPGSMPAQARSLEEEGVVIAPMLMFDQGESRLEEVERIFRGAAYPSRMIADNLADLAAQAAAIRYGVEAVRRLGREAGAARLEANMDRLYHRAAAAVRVRLAGLVEREWSARDAMDDGTAVAVTVRTDGRRLEVDFAGSGERVDGNLNATPAIVRSAVLYVLRAWVGEDLPLNEGLLDAVEIRIPAGVLNPAFPQDASQCPAVVGGNVETSQRVVDVLLEALLLQANSQGTMNNFLFGNERFGYYETIGGGSGAGPGWNGMSGTHVHMSNTAITDPEVLERRFPVRLVEFSLRGESGGRGAWRGGTGLVREVEFLEAMTVSLLTQRRTRAPRGGAGGEDGTPGQQALIRPDGSVELLPPVCSIAIKAGERIRIETPGGGGWGVGPDAPPDLRPGSNE